MSIIKTLGDFRKLTKDLGDDFEIEFRVRIRVPEEELKNGHTLIRMTLNTSRGLSLMMLAIATKWPVLV